MKASSNFNAGRILVPLALLVLVLGAGSYFSAGTQTHINSIQGMAAHDATAAGNPLRMGGKASTGLPAAVANGDAVDAYFDLNGRQVVVVGSAFQASVDTFSPGANATVDGLLTHRFAPNGTNAALSNTTQTVKASAGRLYGYELRNTNASVMFVHVYDSSSVTVGTTAPIITIAVPGGSGTAPGLAVERITIPIAFGTQVRIAATTSDDHTVSTAPGTGLSGVIYYK
jgi:hypothetical protein